MSVPANVLDRRLVRARAEVQAAEAEACLVTHLPNIAWLTGFRGTSAALIVTPTWLYFITDFRYSRTVELLKSSGRLASGCEIVMAERGLDDTVLEVLRQHGGRRTAFEADHLTVSRFRMFQRALATRMSLVPLAAPLERLRAVKDDEELQIFREATLRLAAVAERIPEFAHRGRSESAIAADIEHSLKLAGFERPAFETIVASGPNSALPHARPTDRVLEPRDPVVLDFGGVYGGYCVDLTRTGVVGRASEPFERLFQAVQSAHAAALASIRPGVRASQIDAAARGTFEREGVADAFGHATGHGLGLEVHEYPRIGRAGADGEDPVIVAGMVFTIEPGLYVPSIGGVRIEDDVLVGEAGAEILTDIPRGLLVLGA
jgi:Xaa-Pro aminopeptidase